MVGFVPVFLMQVFVANEMLAAPLVMAAAFGIGCLDLWWLMRVMRGARGR